MIPNLEFPRDTVYTSFHLNALSRLSARVRKRIFHTFVGEMRPTAATKVLDIGMTGIIDDRWVEVNYFERLYPWLENVHGVTLDNPETLQKKFPQMSFTRADGCMLPFPDKSFDIAFSSAVIEHVGSRERQKKFVSEACRVAKNVFLTTPNRYFPVESHSRLPLVNFLPNALFWNLMRLLGWRDLVGEENLNLLGPKDFLELFDAATHPKLIKVRFCFLTQNLIAVARGAT